MRLNDGGGRCGFRLLFFVTYIIDVPYTRFFIIQIKSGCTETRASRGVCGFNAVHMCIKDARDDATRDKHISGVRVIFVLGVCACLCYIRCGAAKRQQRAVRHSQHVYANACVMCVCFAGRTSAWKAFGFCAYEQNSYVLDTLH